MNDIKEADLINTFVMFVKGDTLSSDDGYVYYGRYTHVPATLHMALEEMYSGDLIKTFKAQTIPKEGVFLYVIITEKLKNEIDFMLL